MDKRSRVSVLVADDHPLVRDGLKRMIDDQPDMVVVGEATNGPEAVEKAQRLAPRIVLLDVSMPEIDGITVAQTLTATCPAVRIIALTRHTETVFVAKMLGAGADGYVLKQSPTAELLRAVRAVATGEQYVDAALQVASAPDVPGSRPSSEPGSREPLTAAEEQVLHLVARAHSNRDIAQQLHLDLHAVGDLKATAMRKAGLKTRLDVVAYATARGWRKVPGNVQWSTTHNKP